MTISSSSEHFNGRVRSFRGQNHQSAYEAHKKKFNRHYRNNRPHISTTAEPLPKPLLQKASRSSKLKGLSKLKMALPTNANPEKQITPPPALTGDKLDFSFRNAAFPSPTTNKFDFSPNHALNREKSSTFPSYQPESPNGMELGESQENLTQPKFGIPSSLVKRHTIGTFDLSKPKKGAGITKNSKETPTIAAPKPRQRRTAVSSLDLQHLVNSGIMEPTKRNQHLFAEYKIRDPHEKTKEEPGSPNPFKAKSPDIKDLQASEPSKTHQETDPELEKMLSKWQ